MVLTSNQLVKLSDTAGRDIGGIVVERVEGELLLGTFAPGADYAAVRAAFDGFAEAVDYGALAVVDAFDQQIAALGLRATLGGSSVPARDLQIYPDGGASCRVPLAGPNGAPASH